MRRARPKSYVLATSASLPETEHPITYGNEESRDLSSMGSMSSVDNTFRSTGSNANSHQQNSANSNSHHHSSGVHRLQKFINLFNHAKSDRTSKFRPKRSRTSLPANRNPLPDTLLKASKIIRQGWLRHQELALGKPGKRRQWEPCYAVLYDQSLFLSPQEPTAAFSEATGEKLTKVFFSASNYRPALELTSIHLSLT
ncbi:hypothetical protein WR25_10758 [Diploscapter pachys]|uniref:PH domain-containing protein n=1 Tax=Diploscapter pachys TaxID=2018661 RepID=A0A2A2JBA1_9BILA|nr:hypothetical protein WR25_10758 [Diploscapter pachys]